jgi:hypothetical protein
MSEIIRFEGSTTLEKFNQITDLIQAGRIAMAKKGDFYPTCRCFRWKKVEVSAEEIISLPDEDSVKFSLAYHDEMFLLKGSRLHFLKKVFGMLVGDFKQIR